MTVKGSPKEFAELAAEMVAIADRAIPQLVKIEEQARREEAFRLSAHCNTRESRFIPRRGENRILGGPLSLAQRHAAGRISVRGGGK